MCFSLSFVENQTARRCRFMFRFFSFESSSYAEVALFPSVLKGTKHCYNYETEGSSFRYLIAVYETMKKSLVAGREYASVSSLPNH